MVKLVYLSTVVSEIQSNQYGCVSLAVIDQVIQVFWEAVAAMNTISRESKWLGLCFDPFQLCFKSFTRAMANVSKDTFK